VKLPDINAKPGKQGAGVKAKAKAGAASADNSKTILNDVLASAGVDVVTTSASDGTTSSSKQKTAARLILGCVLRFQAQFEFRRTKQALLAEQLERETIEATARLEKKRFERQAVKKVEEMRKKKEQALKKTNFFDALYDGEAGEAQKLLEQDPKLLLEATDSDGHGPLAAAANGGSAEIVRMLLDYGCNPNLQGEFQRTALWRAAFSGNAEVAEILLQAGADPALYDSSFQTPLAVCPHDSPCEEILNDWVQHRGEETKVLKEKLLEKLDAGRRKLGQLTRKQADARLEAVAAEIRKEEEKLELAKKEAAEGYRTWSEKVLKKIEQSTPPAGAPTSETSTTSSSSHVLARGQEPTAASSTSTNDAELYIREMASQLQLLKRKLEDAVHRVEELKLKYEELQEEIDPNSKKDHNNLKLQHLTILPFRLLSDAVLRGSGPHAITREMRFPLVWDSSGRASVFFEYSGATLLRMWNMSDTRSMRRALLNCVRHDIPFVLDTMGAPIGVDHLEICLQYLLPNSVYTRAGLLAVGGGAGGAGRGSSLSSSCAVSSAGEKLLGPPAPLEDGATSSSQRTPSSALATLRREGILELVLSKRLFQEEDLLFELLVDAKVDGNEFQRYEFALEPKNFKFILLSSCETPDMALLGKFHVVRVVANH